MTKKLSKNTSSNRKLNSVLNIKSLSLIVIVIVSGSIVVFNPGLLSDVSNLIFGNPNHQNNNNNTTDNQTIIQNNFKNATLLPPFPTAKFNLAGGNQYADLRFEMNVVPPTQSNYQYTNMKFIGTISNMSEDLSTYPINKEDTFTFQTNVKDCLYGPGENNIYNGGPTYVPNATSAVTAGDINGNGQDEFITVYSSECKANFDSKLTIMDWNKMNNNFSTWVDMHIGLYDPQVLAADLKGIGISEVILTGFKSNTTSDLTIEIFDFSPNNETVTNPNSLTITNFTLSSTNLLPKTQIFMDKGNVEGTPNQQFFIYGQTTTRQYTCMLFDYKIETKTLTKITSWTDADLGRPIFAPWKYNGYEQMVFPKREEVRPLNETYDTTPPVYPENIQLHTNESGFIYQIFNDSAQKIVYFPYRGIVGQGNVKADGKMYIVLLRYCTSASCPNDISLFTPYDSYTLKDSSGNYIPLQELQHFSSGVSFNHFVQDIVDSSTFRSNEKVFVTDLNFDTAPEILFTGADGTRFFWIRGDTLNATSNNNNIVSPYEPDLKVAYMDFTQSKIFHSLSNASVVGNFYNQSIICKYQEVSYLSDGKPTILAVLAAPPTKSDISQNYLTSEVGFGQSSTASQSHERSFGYTIGGKLTFSYEKGDEKLLKFEGALSLSFDYGSTTSSKVTHSYEFSNSWSTDSEHNGVVYSAMKYKNWNYTIIDANNPALNGHTLTYSYPYYVGVYKFDADAFDQAHPGYNIDSMTFNHTIGDPTTYPSQSQATTLTQGSPFSYMAPSLRPVNQGGAGDDQEIKVDQESSLSASQDYTVGASASVKFTHLGLSIEAEVSTSATWGEASESSLGTGTAYTARIGQIANISDWNQWSYGWGLFIYLLNRTDLNIRYQVIDFYTGNFGVGYTVPMYSMNGQDSNHVQKPLTIIVQLLQQKNKMKI